MLLSIAILLILQYSTLNVLVECNLQFHPVPELELSSESIEGELAIDAEFGAELFWTGFHLAHKSNEHSENTQSLFLLAVLDESTVVRRRASFRA